jgi:serine protease Do
MSRQSSWLAWALGVIAANVPVAMAEVPQQSLADAVARVIPSVVAISASHPEAHDIASITGSGFVIDPTGLIVTNRHVISGASAIVVTLSDGTTLNAMLAGEAPRSDIAVLRVFPSAPLPPVQFGDSDKLRIADTVIAIGNPLGFTDTVTAGIVSGLNRDIMDTPFDEFIQTDAAINHGNSGGPLVNTDGKVIGMNTLIVAPGTYGGSIGLGFAIPSDILKFVTDEVRDYGHVTPGWIGAGFQQMTPQLREGFRLAATTTGAIVMRVDPHSPAAASGLQVGDVVLAFNGETISDIRELARAIAKAPIGRSASMLIWRGSARQTVDVVVIADPDSPVGVTYNSAARSPSEQLPMHLGLQLADQHEGGTEQDGAVAIVGVAPRSTAANAGLFVGDLVIQVENCGKGDASTIKQCLDRMSAAGEQYADVFVQHDNARRWVALKMPSGE